MNEQTPGLLMNDKEEERKGEKYEVMMSQESMESVTGDTGSGCHPC